jgi:hypothetical protein
MPTPPPVSDTRGADIIVVVGADLAKAAPTPTSPTTARRTTATTVHSTATTVRTATTVKSVTTTTAKH